LIFNTKKGACPFFFSDIDFQDRTVQRLDHREARSWENARVPGTKLKADSIVGPAFLAVALGQQRLAIQAFCVQALQANQPGAFHPGGAGRQGCWQGGKLPR
jgi:hypothetical protein